MLLFIPAARLTVVVTQQPVVSVYNDGASPVPKQVASRRGVNGENQRRPPFGLKAMVAKKVCRVIGWALKYRLYLGERCPAFSSGIEGLSVAYRVASPLPPGRRLSNSFDAKSLEYARAQCPPESSRRQRVSREGFQFRKWHVKIGTWR